MKIDIITLFPGSFESYFNESMMKIARSKGQLELAIHNLRDFSNDKHKNVDDKQFGGGAGMVIMIEPVYNALKKLKTKDSWVITTSAKGITYKQSKAKFLSNKNHLIIICGHYEGFDQRIYDYLTDEVISIGNFVLTGGELPAMIIVDSVIRLLPGVLGNEESPIHDSFYDDDKTIQYPVYTRPANFKIDGKNLIVPDVLLSGDHKKIEEWRKSNLKT